MTIRSMYKESAPQVGESPRGSGSARAIAAIAAAGGVAIIAYVIWTARLLRPIADDYCLAQAAGKGFFGSLSFWFTTWSGDVTARVSDYVWVGFPLVALPWGVASALPFVATSAALTAVVLALLAGGASGALRAQAPWLFLVPILPVAWWAYWWIPVRVGAMRSDGSGDGLTVDLANSITTWQTVNSAYVLLPCVLLLLLLVARPILRRSWKISVPVFLALGFVIGTAGLVLAGATLLAISAAVVAQVALRLRWRTAVLPAVALCSGLLVGVVISYLSPGSRARAEILAENPALDPVTLSSLWDWVFPQAIGEWLSGLVNWGSLLAFVLVGGMGFLATRAGLRADVVRLERVSAGLVGFSFLLSLTNRASEAFAYPAFWHQISTRTFIFLALSLLAVSVGARLATFKQGFLVIVPAVFALGLVAAATSMVTLSGSVQERFSRWEAGPAPLGSISDTAESWSAECWTDLTRLRDGADPARTP